MEDSKKLKENFEKLKTAVSDYYPGEYFKWLRCCLYGIVNGAELNKTGVGCHLFNALERQGVISPTNIKLLTEINELTDVKGAIDCVNKYKRDNNVEDTEGKILTPYRRGLVKALMCAGEDELNNVVGNYTELSPYEFGNLWDVVLKLERKKLLEDNPGKIQRFANLLEEDTKALFLGETCISIMQSTPSRASASSTSSGSLALLTPAATEQDEIIREYLLENQKIMCSNCNRFTPPIMQTKFKVDIAHMFTDLDLLTKMNNGEQNAKPTNLDELLGIIKEKPACKVLIEGEGGIGKTTLLRYLAYNWSTEKSDKQPFKGKILFFINIRDIGEGEDALDAIVKHVKLKDFNRKTGLPKDSTLIERFIFHHDDEIVLLLDGLDELKKGSESPISLFEKKEFQRSVVILTSRSENIDEFVNNSELHVKVKGFSKENVEEYIKKYFEFECQSELGDSLVRELSRGWHPDFLSMCRNPMLLLSICIIWLERQEIPSDNAELFREIFRCILNQYNRDESKPKIHLFEDIPKQYLSAMCLLGHCMYHGLKKNKLSINKRDLVANEDIITIALKLGFVYKDESFLRTSFEEIYAAPHKLIVESLAGFYLYKLWENIVDMPTNLLPDDKKWEEIRENKYLENAHMFAISFLGANADKFLKNWITNSLSAYRSLGKYIPLVKQEHVGAVMKALIDHLDNSNLEIKQHIPDVCRSLKLWIDHINPNAGVDNILHLIGEIYNSKIEAEIYRFTNKMSPREKGRFMAHILIAVKHQIFILQNIFIGWNEKELKHFTDECEKLHITYDITSFTLNVTKNSSYFVYLLTHSPRLSIICFSCKGNTGRFLNDTMEMFSNIKGCKLKLENLDINDNNLSNLSGTSLASLLKISPNLGKLHMKNCNLTGDVINDMATYCSRGCIKLSKLHDLDINDNNFSNINGTLLASFFAISPKLGILHMNNCKLTGDVINDMATYCFRRGIKLLELHDLDINDNNFSNINGTSLASLLEVSPNLGIFHMKNCNLTGDVINDMATYCSRRGVKLLELHNLDINDNHFSNINGTSLATLLKMSPKLSTLSMNNCKLKGDVINDTMADCSSRSIKLLKLEDLYINNNNLSNLNGKSLALLMEISPKLSKLQMQNCNLTGDVINGMMKECSSRGIQLLELSILYITDNHFCNLNGTSLTSLMDISPKLRILFMERCCLTGDVINGMMAYCSSRGIKLLELHNLDISYNNFRKLKGTSLAKLMDTTPKLNRLWMQNCNLTGNVINDFMAHCSSRGTKLLQLHHLDISNNNFSYLNGTSLASLMEISPKLSMLYIQNCNLTGDVINDMMTECSSRGIRFLELYHLNISDNNFSNIQSKSLASLMDISPKMNVLYIQNCKLKGNFIKDTMTDCSRRGIELHV